jgi:hypothetical protein
MQDLRKEVIVDLVGQCLKLFCILLVKNCLKLILYTLSEELSKLFCCSMLK